MFNDWKRIDTKTNKILLKIKEDDILNEIWENNEYDITQEGFSKKYNDYENNFEIHYWINKEEKNEDDAIIEFNEKCKKWSIKQYIEKDIYLTIDKNVDFDNFDFIKDDYFNEEWNNYLFTYKNKNTYIKLDNVDIEVIEDNYNNKYIEINENNEKLDNFMKNLESRIIKCKNEDTNNFNIEDNYEYKYYKNEDGNYKFKIKRDNIYAKQYNNSDIYIKCNRIWKLNYQKQGNDIYSWGVSLIVDKIHEKEV
jgi:hypothetical protein